MYILEIKCSYDVGLKMTEINIPKSVKEIIQLSARFNFEPLTYKMIAELLGKDTNAIVQRIKRNPEYFDLTNKKPFKITIKKGIDQVYFIKDKQQCQICRKMFKPDKLLIRFKDPHMKDKYNWKNVITCCKGCQDKEISKKTTKKGAKRSKRKGVRWEYKEIGIKRVEKERWVYSTRNRLAHMGSMVDAEEQEEEEDFYEFNEWNGQGWFHLTDDDNDTISSWSITDVLNYFGDDGWELIRIKEYEYEVFNEERYNCFFKRRKTGDGNSGSG